MATKTKTASLLDGSLDFLAAEEFAKDCRAAMDAMRPALTKEAKGEGVTLDDARAVKEGCKQLEWHPDRLRSEIEALRVHFQGVAALGPDGGEARTVELREQREELTAQVKALEEQLRATKIAQREAVHAGIAHSHLKTSVANFRQTHAYLLGDDYQGEQIAPKPTVMTAFTTA